MITEKKLILLQKRYIVIDRAEDGKLDIDVANIAQKSPKGPLSIGHHEQIVDLTPITIID